MVERLSVDYAALGRGERAVRADAARLGAKAVWLSAAQHALAGALPGSATGAAWAEVADGWGAAARAEGTQLDVLATGIRAAVETYTAVDKNTTLIFERSTEQV